MMSHRDIDRRSIRLAQAVVEKVERHGMEGEAVRRAIETNRRWRARSSSRLHDRWADILALPWPSIRSALLDDSERGRELRQNNPFCGILTPQERWGIYREFRAHDA